LGDVGSGSKKKGLFDNMFDEMFGG